MNLPCVVTRCLIVLLSFGCAHCAPAQEIILHEGEIGEYRFHFDSPATTTGGPINFLAYQGGMALSLNFNLRVSLYDGEHLLGSHLVPDSGNPFMNFFAIGAPVPSHLTDYEFVNFSTLANGTIDGRMTFEMFQPAPNEYVSLQSISFYTGRQQNTLNGFLGGPTPVLDSIVVRSASAVPEPSTYGLVFGAAALALAGVRCRVQSRRPQT